MSLGDVDFPIKLQPLFKPKRFKVLKGGRGGAKSWGIARSLIVQASYKALRIGCFREIQKSIKESSHTLIKMQIEAIGLPGWTVQETRIFHVNGSEFVFAGLRSLNVENIKSFEGLDIAWVEEARNISKKSWDILIPTIRKDGSEIWISFNPELIDDETYKRFVARSHLDDDIVVIDMSWRDNPWFPTVLEKERLRMERDDPDGYLTTWEGKPRQYLEGAIYAAEIRKATTEDRITRVPYEPLRPVHTFWDLGYSDATAIWLIQSIGVGEFHVIDYIEAFGERLEHYVKELTRRDYLWGLDWLPHDARAKTLASGGMSIEQMLRKAGRDVRITPNLSLVDGINAARTIFGRCYFDEDKTREGMNRLRRYAYKLDDNGQRSKIPIHDDESHGADAFRYFAVANSIVARRDAKKTFKITNLAVN